MLLIDNCSAHGSVDSLPPVENVDVVFLPPKTTSKLQPLDAGIIAALKIRYRQLQYDHAIDRIDAGIDNVYKVDQLTVMRWMRNICDQSTRRLRLCQRRRISPLLWRLCLTICPKMSVEFLVSPAGENDCVEEPDVDILADEAVAGIIADQEEGEGGQEDENSYLDKLSFEEKRRSVVVVRHLLKTFDTVDPMMDSVIRTSSASRFTRCAALRSGN